jgi:hypothetical protein
MVGPRTARGRAALDESATKAVTAKNRGTDRWDRQRELRDPTGRNRRITEMPRRVASATWRLATAEEAATGHGPSGGLPG